MKKYLFALAIGMLLVFAFATVALADNGPHGSFLATTDACASCHRAHSAKYGSNSLLIMDPEQLCMSCHDGTGAGTNVHDGVYAQSGANTYYGGGTTEGVDGASLFGGGFTNALMATAWSGKLTPDAAFNALSRPITSAHDIGAPGTIWGSGAANSANGGLVLECTSCHDPHGTAGWTVIAADGNDTRVASYRLLRWQPQGSNGFTSPGNFNWTGGAFPISDMGTVGGTDVSGWLVPDNFAAIGTEWYTIGTQTTLNNCGSGGTSACGSPFAAGDYLAGTTNIVYRPTDGAATKNYVPAANGVAYFCAQCHDRYFANSRLRNATDFSAYCYGAATMTAFSSTNQFASFNGINNPAALTDISTVDATYCVPAVNSAASNASGLVWADNRPSGDNTYMYMHSSGDIRASADGVVTAGSGSTIGRSCVTCHVAHGTAAQMTAFAATADNPTAVPPVVGASLAGGSTLLRMDNRSLCLRCHAGTVNFTVAP